MKVNSDIFRAYDIRGIVDEDLTKETVFHIGKAIGTLIQNQGRKDLLVARDGRSSGERLKKLFEKGVMESGCNVLSLGSVPTPLLYFATFVTPYQDGVMITGSHNPKNYNGFKIVVGKKSLTLDQIEQIKIIIQEESYKEGNGSNLSIDIKNDYIETLKKKINIKKKLKICLDCGNGIGGIIAPKVFKVFGLEVIELYSEVDGNFPNHHPDPSKPENLKDLIRVVKEKNCDLGIALDGDGDRVGIVDDSGKIIFPDRYMMLVAEFLLKNNPKEKIIYDVKCTSNLKKLILEKDGIPIMTRTGHSYIKSKILETNALFGGEMSGHIFFNDNWYGFDDALFSSLRIIEIISEQKKSSSEIFNSYDNYISTPELNIEVNEHDKFKIIDSFKKIINSEGFERIEIDGLRLERPNAWGLIRASNTSPSLVLRFEGKTRKDLNFIKNHFQESLSKIDPNLNIS